MRTRFLYKYNDGTGIFKFQITTYSFHHMAQNTSKAMRDEHGKLLLAEHLFNAYNGILACPGCGNISAKGTFRKSVAGKANKSGERYRRYVCICSDIHGIEHCGRTIGTTKLIELCRLSKQVGSSTVDRMMSQLDGVFLPVTIILSTLEYPLLILVV